MKILDKLAAEFSKTATPTIGKAIEDLATDALSRRKPHERRWYDNNFFDDGFHFRVISRKTGRIIDHAQQTSGYVERAIPRASRQIRGIANLLFGAEPYPVIYPERLTVEDFKLPGGQVDQQRFMQAYEEAKKTARKQGVWVSNTWEDLELPLKLIDMILLAAKNSVSWIQVYSDTKKQELKVDIYDAFDVLVYGEYRNVKDLPFIIKTCPMSLQEIQKDPRFEPSMVAQLNPDNKYATSEVKEAYMRSRYGNKSNEETKGSGSIIVKESFLKEVLTEENWKNAVRLGEENGAMEHKSKGDMIMRHPFSAGGVTLCDEYVDYDEYPLVDLRFEPGPIYQTPFIERFIPQNKSVDVIISRLEKWVNAMVVGVYQKRKGENYQVSNFPGGQVLEYETTPLAQMQNGTVGATPFNVLETLNKYIDEQGATTSTLNQIPSGVKAARAIENIKASEYANLKIPTLMLKDTIKRITELMLERTHKDYLEPHETSAIEDGEPDYFDVIGQRGLELSKKINVPLPEGIIPIKKDLKVRIEIEPGLGLTMDGKKDAMESILTQTAEFMKLNPNIIPMEAFSMMFKRFLETFGYGSTQELMEAMETGMTNQDVTEETLQKMQIALLTALKDSGAVGPEAEKRLVDSTKVGVAEVMKDLGMTDGQKETPEKGPSKSISFKDLPPEGKAQLAAQAGIQLNPQQIAIDEAQEKQQDMQMKQRELQIKEKKAQPKK